MSHRLRERQRARQLAMAIPLAQEFEEKILSIILNAEEVLPTDPEWKGLRKAARGMERAARVARDIDRMIPLPGLAEAFDGPILFLIVSLVFAAQKTKVKKARRARARKVKAAEKAAAKAAPKVEEVEEKAVAKVEEVDEAALAVTKVEAETDKQTDEQTEE